MLVDATDNIIEQLFDEHQAIVQVLESAGEVSLRNSADNYFRKTLLVAGASNMETRLTSCLERLFAGSSAVPDVMVEFLKNKAIARQYHTFFDWDARNGNKFFSLFGPRFRDHMNQKVADDSDLGESIRAFVELGSLRNQLVHGNFIIFPLEKTVDEILKLYRQAADFVTAFESIFRDYIEHGVAARNAEPTETDA